MSAPIQLYGPYYGRRLRALQRTARVLRTVVIAVCLVVGLPMAAGVAYATYLLATGR